MECISAKRLVKGDNWKMTHVFEKFFYWWGCTVSSNPWKIILSTLLVTSLAALGLLNFSWENDGWKLWLPEGSRHSVVTNWKKEYFVEDIRGTITLFNHEENVLTKEALLLLLDLHQKVQSVQFDGGNFNKACLKIPITNILLANKRKKRHAIESRTELEASEYGDNDTDYNEYFNFYDIDEIQEEDVEAQEMIEGVPRDIYCDIVETLEDKCGEYSLLEIWNYDKTLISNLTEQDIINAVNTVDESPVFGYPVNYINYLGSVEYNSTGNAITARSIRSVWLEQFDPNNIPPSRNLFGFEVEPVDSFTYGYEEEVLKMLKKWSVERDDEEKGYSLFMNLGLSFVNESSGPLEDDVQRQIVGYILMFIYAFFCMGKLNTVENKFYLAAAGISSVFFGVIIGLGMTLALGLPYTMVTAMVPFICLGIGIDDMFVIKRCFDNIIEGQEDGGNTLAKNVGLAMKHAGAAITVTTLTDICAFAIGGMTYFPGVKYFCICAAIAITFIYLFQTSFFVAWMVLDQKRIKEKRNGFIPCIVHKDWQKPKWSQKNMSTSIACKVAKLFEFHLFQISIIIITMSFLSIGIWAASEIEIEYDIKFLIPEDSYLKAWIRQNDEHFPSNGYGVTFYSQEVSYDLEDFLKVDLIVNDLDNLTKTHNEWVHYGKKDLPKTVHTPWEISTGFWWQDLKKFMAKQKNIHDWKTAFTEGKFPIYFSDFLHHEDGSIYNNSFRFSADLKCNLDAPPITAMKLGSLRFRDLTGLTRHMAATQAIDNILSRANLSSTTFAYSYIYPPWEIDTILAAELFQNMSITLACVSLITFITLSDLRACIFTMACVLFTIIDVVGAIFLMGMTIDAFSVTCFIMAIGFSVDYCAHIAHSFLMSKGTRSQRAIDGFISISPAIMHGGLSTFLAVIPIGGFSPSHGSKTFFRMVSLTVMFGLFHGLFFLPVALTLFGADATEDDENKTEVNVKRKSDQTSNDPSCECENEVYNSSNGTDNPSYKTDNSKT